MVMQIFADSLDARFAAARVRERRSRGSDLCWDDRMGHAAAQGNVQRDRRRHHHGPKGHHGALRLYLDFVNLLFYLLRFLGNRVCNDRLYRILRDSRPRKYLIQCGQGRLSRGAMVFR
jgi:hypothetical protein